jgi:hypothetical protein
VIVQRLDAADLRMAAEELRRAVELLVNVIESLETAEDYCKKRSTQGRIKKGVVLPFGDLNGTIGEAPPVEAAAG